MRGFPCLGLEQANSLLNIVRNIERHALLWWPIILTWLVLIWKSSFCWNFLNDKNCYVLQGYSIDRPPFWKKKTNTKFRNHKYKYSQKIKVRLSIVSLIIENLMMKRTGTCTIIKLIVELDFILLFSWRSSHL